MAVLAIPFVWYNAVHYGILLTYGIVEWRLALIIAGVIRGLTIAPVVAGMISFHEHSRKERILIGGFCLLLVAVIILPFRGAIYSAQALIGLGFFIIQPYTIIRMRQTGVLEIKVFVVGCLSNCFWAWYAYEIGDSVIFYTAMMFAVSLLFTTILFWIYPEHNEKAAA